MGVCKRSSCEATLTEGLEVVGVRPRRSLMDELTGAANYVKNGH